ncbi:MAG: alpha/beta fold hydrolase [Alcanivoracaceae bacterium]|nr:alpha/beta fold hydrolase [Alcanivoracaceae bacterium]
MPVSVPGPARKAARYIRHTSRNARTRLLDPASLVEAERTPYEVIYEEDIVRVRYYPPLDVDHITVNGEQVTVQKQAHATPLVLVSPLAVNMYIYDLFEQRSLVKYLRARGFELYLIDWGRPDARHNHYTLSTYFADWMPRLLAQVRQHSGSQKLSLHGWSFGGLFSYAYTALGDPDIANLVLLGAPCDYHANGALGKQYQRLARQMRWMEKRFGFKVHNTRKRYWRSPGWMNSLAFKLTNPVASVQGYVDLVRNLHDAEYVRSHTTNGAFLDDMVAYPGAVVQDIIQHLWTDNVLGNGELPLQDSRKRNVPLQLNNASVLMICGEDDPIVTKDCSTALLKQVHSDDVTVRDVPGGHMGILGGSRAPRESWQAISDWLAERSNPAQAQRSA